MVAPVSDTDFVLQHLPIDRRARYRIRKVVKSEVPILADLSTFKEKEVIVVDLATDAERKSDTVSERELSEYGNSSAVDSSDQAGSPLKFSFITLAKLRKGDVNEDVMAVMDGKDSRFECNPLSCTEGRRLVNSISTKEWQIEENVWKIIPTVWIILDASDAMNTAMLGVCKSDRSVILYSVRCFARDDPKIEEYIQPKCAFLEQSQASHTAHCSYELVPLRGNSGNDAVSRISADVQLHAVWKADRTQLLSQPPRSAPVTMSVLVGWLDKRMACSEWSEELCVILALGSALRTGTMTWQPLDPTVTTHQLNAAVRDLLKEEELGHSAPAGDGAEYRDLSERLWVLLKNCSCNKMLVDALQIVWNALRNGYKNTMMHSNNKSTVARMMRDACAEDLKLPRLEGLTPLEILLELGLEHFQRSCIHHFISNGLVVSANDLFSLLPVKQNASTEDRADSVFLLYQALIAMCTCKQYLNLLPQQKNILARRVLSSYSKLNISPTTTGEVSEDMVDKMRLKLDLNVTLNDVYPSVFKIRPPTKWRKESVYMEGKEMSYLVMTHFSKTTKLPYISVNHANYQHFNVDETIKSSEDHSNETLEETKQNNRSIQKRSTPFDGYFGSLLTSTVTHHGLI